MCVLMERSYNVYPFILSHPLSWQVDSAWASGDYVEAKQNAKMAKWCGLAGIISAIVFYVVVIVIVTVVTTLAT